MGKDDVAFSRRWGPVLVLGPVLPALVGAITVVVGSIVVHADPIDPTEPEYCGYPLDGFLKAAIANSYLLLLVFSWSFIGTDVAITIRGIRWRLLRPFGRLRTLLLAYSIPALLSIAIWIFGTWTVSQGNIRCAELNPTLFAFTSFLVIIYWIGVVFGVMSLIKILGRKSIIGVAAMTAGAGAAAVQRLEEKMVDHEEEQLVVSKFKELDEEGAGCIDRDDVEGLLSSLGMQLTQKQLQKAFMELDEDGEGSVELEPFLRWYSRTSKELMAG
ncbi:unnamed protein product [Chrysoparadoxa australica]